MKAINGNKNEALIKLVYKNKNQSKKLKRLADNFYKKFVQSKSVKNEDLNILIHFNSVGRIETIRKKTINIQKCIAIINIIELLKYAKYCNWKYPKPAHVKKYHAIGFLNFQSKLLIKNKYYYFRIPVMVSETKGKFQYYINQNIVVDIEKKKPETTAD